MFIAFALLIATVAALPMETAERSTKQLVAQAEGEAQLALNNIATSVGEIDVSALTDLATKVGGIEDDVPAKVEELKLAISAAA